ncbi:MazG Predicted pyrophosphatase [uncultured Caudovirales phage]|uniref:MazG Predicted pyrophosphatase n=1 Tax=uncultured Caudovirales phage TaxID=2100421 RepID=A0A6J5RM76_9CAUD|nr:MazG Predicted pyrophosphatase [uncultured Caudovirales phage]
MDFNVFQASANKTAKNLGETGDLLHAALGLAGEAGEFVDCVKKHTVYGQPLDTNNAKEELGDLLWFIALGCKALGVSMEAVASENIAKLQKRYPGAYSDANAMLRLDKGNQ